MAEAEEEIVFYMTFEAEAIYKPKKPLFLSWEAGSDSHTEEKDVYELSVKDYKYQRQIGYIPRGDSDLVKDIIESDLWDTENSVVLCYKEGGNQIGKRRASGEGLLRWRKDRKHWEGRIVIGTNENGKPISKCFSGKTQREVVERMARYR